MGMREKGEKMKNREGWENGDERERRKEEMEKKRKNNFF
jgi:hypothetical protein